MQKKIYVFCLLLLLVISVKAQQYYPYVLGYVAGEQEAHNGGVGDIFKVSFSGATPFADTTMRGLSPGANRVLYGMKYDLLYVDNAFDKDLFASKGYYGDFIELKWDLIRYVNQVSRFLIYRKELGSTLDSVLVANIPKDSRSWKDEYAESGVMYKYFLFADDVYLSYHKMLNYIDGIGFRVPYGRVSGRVTYKGGAAVPDVNIIAETEDNFSGSSIKLNGTDAYLAITPVLDAPLFKLDTAMTFQAWYRPEASVGARTLFEKQGQYQLTHTTGSITFTAGAQSLTCTFTEKIDTFFHVTAMRTADSIKIFVIYDESTSYIKKEKLTGVTTANNNPVYIGKDNTGNFFKGWVDEVKIWHKSFPEKDIIRYAGMYFAGTENNLSAYYRMNEGIGDNFFDLSRKGFTFNANDGYKHSTAVWDKVVVPYSRQLAVKGITDKNGNYIIAGIPYATDGSIYRFVPIYGVHNFDPTEKLLFIGPGATSSSNIDFIDVASFPVSGYVYYRNTKFPVEGVSIKIDGQPAVTSEGKLILSDNFGKFMVDVPIGQHFIQLSMNGHGLINKGRFPAVEGTFYDFQQPYTIQTDFLDTTLIKVVGKVVGGPVQASKPIGLGKTTNNLGLGKIILTSQKDKILTDGLVDIAGIWQNEMYQDAAKIDKGDTKYAIKIAAPKQIEVEPDPLTGEFFAYLLPEKYVIKGITAGTYTYPTSFHTVIDLSNVLLGKTEIDSVKIEPPIITPTNDTIYNYRIDSVQYKLNLNLIYRNNPTLTVGGKDAVQFWETDVKAKDGIIVHVVDATGDPLTDWPILLQRKNYDLKISVFERYTNAGVDDDVPVTDGNVEIINSLATDKAKKLFQVSKLGIVNYSFTGGLANFGGDYTNSMSIIAYTGNGGTISTPWEYKMLSKSYSGPFKAYIKGGLPSGDNFITTGPTEVDMILRDPPGSSSYAYFEQNSSVSKTTSTNVLSESGSSLSGDAMLGGTVKTFAGVGAGVIIETSNHNTVSTGYQKSETWVDDNTTTSTITTTKRWQTSDDPEFVGTLGDVFIGHSTNIVYGKCDFLELLPASADPDRKGAVVSGYQIGQYVGIRINPEFGTAFQYSQNHIKNYLIPAIEDLRNLFITNHTGAPFFYTSHYPVGDPLYGSDNDPKATKTGVEYIGSSYNFTVPATWPALTLFTDTVAYYNKQIAGWEAILSQNEKEKLEAVLKENLSYDAGVIYESSETHSSTVATTRSYEFQMSPFLANETGFDVMDIGFTIKLEKHSNNVKTSTTGTETTKEVTFGFVLNDNDEGDYFSVDVKTPKAHTGPVFKTRGGQSQCPHEHAEVTEYFKPLGQILSVAVMQREKPQINCTVKSLNNVPEDQPAIFQVELFNNSETGDDAWFMVSVDELSNQDGAKISLDGQSISNGRVIYVPAKTTLKKLITIEKIDPAVNDYNDIGIIMHSVCQFDPGNNWPDIADTVKLTAKFKPVCSRVDITSLADLWVINKSSGTILNVGIDNYNLAHTGFEKILVQYKSTSTSSWTSDMIYYVNKVDFDAAPAPKTWINGLTSLVYAMDLNSLTDRNYDIRVATTCSAGTTVNESKVLTGIKDTKLPQVFGTPQPGDGILSPGDDVMLSFDEQIQAGLLLSKNFSVRAVVNGAQLRHNSALYFDGIDNYASVIAGVNLKDKSFTVEFWTKRSDLLNSGVIFEQGDIQMGFDATDKFYVKLKSQTQATTLAYNFTDKWIHFAVNFDYLTKNLSIYSAYDGHNAMEIENVSFPTGFEGNGKMYIGKDNAGISAYNGYLHDFRIWEKVKGYGTVNSNMVVSLNGDEIGLGGFWPMDEAQGVYAQDLSRSHHAMLVGASWKVFPTGNARTFNGTDSYVNIPTATSIIITNEMDMTMEFWFKAAPAQTNTVMFSNGKADATDGTTSNPDIWIIGINSIGEIYAKNNNVSITAVGEKFLDNKWHHLSLVLNRRGNTSLLIDGNVKSYENSSSFGGIKGAEMTIGASRHYTNGTPYSNFFQGSIDEFRFWKLARTTKLLNMDMNSKLTGEEKGLVAYYPFDKYDINLILQPNLVDCDFDDNTGVLSGLTATAVNGSYDNTNVPNLKDARPVQNLNYNWVVNNDKIVINILEPAALVEKCVVEFTVDQVADLRENLLASPVTWTAYIKKNTVIWNESQLNFEKEVYAPLSFDVDILNIGGVEQNFTISNLPSWLTANEISGNLMPDSHKTIHFTIAESTNIGKYDVSLFLSSDFGYNEKLELSLNVFRTPPVWIVDPTAFQYSMSIIGKLKVDNLFLTNPEDQVAVFVGDQCRGVAQSKYLSSYDMFEVFLNVFSNTENGEALTFKIWNASEGVIHTEVLPDTVFASNSIIGTISSPTVIQAVNTFTQEIQLSKGWKWVSFNTSSAKLSDLNILLAGLTKTNGDEIKGQKNSLADYSDSLKWNGTLVANGGFKNEQMYMFNLAAPSNTLKYMGAKIIPADKPISINPGWNWIGFLPSSNVTVKDAFGNYTPANGDFVKSQYGFAMYDINMGWLGSLTFMKPGMGYMFKTSNPGTGTLIYPEAGLLKSGDDLKNGSQETEIDKWKVIPEKYKNNLSLIAETDLSDLFDFNDNYILVAFIGEDCRGIMKPIYNSDSKKWTYYTTIYGDTENETVSFKIINTSSNQIFEINETLNFGSNKIVGTISNPIILTAKSTTSVNEDLNISKNSISVFPNPFMSDLSITYEVCETQNVKISIYNQIGILVSTIVNDEVKKGVYTIKLDGNNSTQLNTGVYAVKFESANYSEVIKVIKIK